MPLAMATISGSHSLSDSKIGFVTLSSGRARNLPYDFTILPKTNIGACLIHKSAKARVSGANESVTDVKKFRQLADQALSSESKRRKHKKR